MATSYWFRSGFYTILHKFFTLSFGVLGYVILVRRVLTKEEIGVWVLFQSVTMLFEIGRNGLIRSSLIKYIGESDPSETPKINTASLFLNTVITVVSYAVLVILSPYISNLVNAPQLQVMILYYCVTSFVLIPFSQLNFLQQANLVFKGITLAHFLRMSIFFSGVCYLGFSGKDYSNNNILVMLVLIQAVGVAVGAISNIFSCRKILLYSRNLDYGWIKKLFNFGKYTLVTNLSTILYNKTDQIMLGALINPAAVAIHNMAIRINSLAQLPSLSIAEVLYPKSIERFKDAGTEVLVHLYYRSMGAILGIIIPACLLILIFPEFIIKILAGSNYDEYIQAVPILRLTVLYMIFFPFIQQMAVIIEAYGKPQVNTKFELIAASINIVSNYFFITQFGLMGAIYGTLLSVFIKYLIISVYIKKILGIKPLNSFAYIPLFYKDLFAYIQKFRGKSKL